MAKKRPYLRRGPSGPLADPDTIVQVGYDQAIENMIVPPSGGAEFPRDIAGNPLSVTLPDVKPENFLEVDIRFNLKAALDAYYLTTFSWYFLAIVSFDGVDPVVGNANTFYIIDSFGISEFDDPDVDVPDAQSMSSLAAVEIPDGATTAIVQVLYFSDGDVLVGTDSGLSATLKVSELGVGLVSQPGPGSLVEP